MKATKKVTDKSQTRGKRSFDPFRLISDEEFVSNLNALIAYYQILKGRDRGRFVSSYHYRDDKDYDYTSHTVSDGLFDDKVDDRLVEDDFEVVEDVLEESLV
jgi:hypothetical protein